MVTILLIPKFNFRLKQNEAGIYAAIMPRPPHPSITIWEMWCSSLRWAVQDTYCECSNLLDELFQKDNWEILFYKEEPIEKFNENLSFNLFALDMIRQKYHMPPWEQNKPDKFKRCFSQKPFFDF